MFMCALARPIISINGDVLFDGKIDIFPIYIRIGSQKMECNGDACAVETKPLLNITKEVIREKLIKHILLAKLEKNCQN